VVKIATDTLGSMADVLIHFLSAPPDGTPAEVIEAFSLCGRHAQEPLPPPLFVELVEQAPVAISITDAQADILYTNRAFEELTGYGRNEVLGKNESLLSHPLALDRVYADLWQTLNAKRPWHGTLVNRRKDGKEYLAALTITPVLGTTGEIVYFLGIHRDITREHRMHQQVRHQKTLLESVLDAAPVVVALLDSERRVLLDNQEYKKLLGDLRGREPAELMLRALGQLEGLDLERSARTGSDFRGKEIRLDTPGGRGARWFSCSGTWVSQEGSAVGGHFRPLPNQGPCLLLLAEDVSERRRETEKARIQYLRASLAEQQRVQGMREALAAALFQLQGPLNVIQAAAGMLHPGGGNALRPVLEEVIESGRRALETLRAALPAEVRPPVTLVNLNEVLHEVISLSVDDLLAAGVVVEWKPVPVLPAVYGNKQQLRGLFKYLLDNALTALREGGAANREIRILTRNGGGSLMVELQDNGTGLPEALRLQVFEPFFSAWRDKRGHAGMGLAMAQEIANQHGGGIEIDTTGGSCRVRVVLPEAAGRHPPAGRSP